MTEQNQTNPAESTGARLARLRRSLHITQEELAERLGISRQAVSKWESDLAYPETDKLLLLARLYGCTVDYLLTGEAPAPPTVSAKPDFRTRLAEGWSRRPRYFEYKSQKRVGNLPLIHIHIGVGRKAKGVIAIGLAAQGVVSVGLASMGVLSLGVLSLGLLSMGVLSLGLLSVGSIAAGAVAVGAIAVGILAIGALTAGLISVGGLALGQYLAVGDHARGMIALGQRVAHGTLFQKIGDLHLSGTERAAVAELLDTHCPPVLREIAKIVLRGFGF